MKKVTNSLHYALLHADVIRLQVFDRPGHDKFSVGLFPQRSGLEANVFGQHMNDQTLTAAQEGREHLEPKTKKS